ncbi:hypothetical protein [Paraburkholderia sp. BCC1885]|nr:hypothetical protein [Paraburkholderia sp. BCC1885]
MALATGYRLGRRGIFISFDDIEVEAPTREQAERLLDIAIGIKNRGN